MTTATEASRLTARAVSAEWHLDRGFELGVDGMEGPGSTIWVPVDRVWFGDRAMIHFSCPSINEDIAFPADQEIEIRGA